MDNELMEKLALLSALSDAETDDSDVELYISSMADAERLLKQNSGPKGARIRKRLVDYIVNPENEMYNDCVNYHNFIMALFRMGDYNLALKIGEHVLEKEPDNTDMLGSVIKACGESVLFERGEMYLSKALMIPYCKWSFRLFLYSLEFLKIKLNAHPTNEEVFQRAINLADEYIERFPFDEHGYNQKAELLLAVNRREEAIAELKNSIFYTKPDEKDIHSELVTAQCCITLLNILDASNDYDFIIQICDKGLQHTTQEQPSASIGFFVYRKAMALDAKAHAEHFTNQKTIESAMRFYQVAYDLNQDCQYSHTIEERYAVLRPYIDKWEPLVKRKLFVEE